MPVQSCRFPEPLACIQWPVVDGDVSLWPSAFDTVEADALYAALVEGIDWQTEDVVIFGRRQRVPRLVAWHGERQARYTYSGTLHEPLPWTPALSTVRRRVTALCGFDFNSVLLNRYRDGLDGMGWHADDEPELGRNPVIASVSFGEVRRFRLKHRRRPEHRLDMDLPHGSVLLMSGSLQHHWLHALPKTDRPCGERINLTWRRIFTTSV
jgi:alkylated DNA repair dioxygenase AlkB